MELDTLNTIYVCTDRDNDEVRILTPRKATVQVVHLNLSDPDPSSTDKAEYQLLSQEMDESTIDI